ncbi:hypothetical protein BASA83_012933 [Batrachochytrium salamandrivorans]|nr:hypothetical protein BASA83_012933 [Batrachochytrium salamandrivorans]
MTQTILLLAIPWIPTSMSFNTQYPNFCPSIVLHAEMTQDVSDNPKKSTSFQQEVNTLRTELDFLIQTQRSLTQQPTLQASLSPPVVSQNYTPPRCRLPSDMPRFKRPTAEAQSTVQDFISVFERKLKADSYPTEKYVDALTACCHPEEADWVESSITHCQSWDEAKGRFLRHFIDEDMETLYAYELEGILKNPKESIHAFADCYLHAMRLAKADPNLKHVQVTHFLTRLSDQVRKDVNLVKATRPENVDTVSGIVRTLVTLCPPTKISAKPGSPTQALRWCSYHRSPAHSDEECQAQKRSDFHRPPATAKSGSTSQARRISTCSCTNTAFECTGFQPIVKPNGFTKSYQESEAESKDPTVEDFYELFSKQPSSHLSQSLSEQTGIDYSFAFLVPIIFESVQLSAYIDSGASHSSVPQTLLQQIPHRKVIPPVSNSKTSLGAKNAYTPRLGSIDLPFTWDNKTFTHKFEISDPPAGIQSDWKLVTIRQYNRRQYPIPFNVHGQVKEQIEEWVQTGKVTDAPIGCQYNNPLLVVPKKDLEGKLSKVRVCIDPRQLNKTITSRPISLTIDQGHFSPFSPTPRFSAQLTLRKPTSNYQSYHSTNQRPPSLGAIAI